MHLTVAFIGDADAQRVAPVLNHLRSAPIEVELDQPGLFGSPGRGGVLWIGSEKENQQLLHLRAELVTALSDRHIPHDKKPYVPHVTVARFRRTAPHVLLEQFRNQTLPALPPLRAERLVLYASHQTARGVRYQQKASGMIGGSFSS